MGLSVVNPEKSQANWDGVASLLVVGSQFLIPISLHPYFCHDLTATKHPFLPLDSGFGHVTCLGENIWVVVTVPLPRVPRPSVFLVSLCLCNRP